jgi:hypothetical protein
VTLAEMAEPTFDELGKALKNLEGRKILALEAR